MADLSKIAAQEAGELVEFLKQRHLQEWDAREEKEKALTKAIIERTQWLRALTMGEMKLEYVTVLDDGRLEYNDPNQAVTTPVEPPPVPSPVETCVEPPPTPPDDPDPEDPPESTNGQVSDEFLKEFATTLEKFDAR